jgi:hypothetical protein
MVHVAYGNDWLQAESNEKRYSGEECCPVAVSCIKIAEAKGPEKRLGYYCRFLEACCGRAEKENRHSVCRF